MPDFIQECLSGTAQLTDIDTCVERWHQGNSNKSMYDFLGMTLPEYSLWVEYPDALSKIVTARSTGAKNES